MAVKSSVDKYIASHQKSKKLWERALKTSRGFHSDPRFFIPFPIYVTHAKGSRKWDVDGNEYIDYVMGHGALLLGHAHPAMVKAVTEQLEKGTHYGAAHELEVEWAELVCKLIPAAERVEFAMSGTEANMFIVRMARAYTGRNKILKFAQHYFGWADDLLVGFTPPYDKPSGGQMLPTGTVVIPCNDEVAMEKALAKKDIAAFFLEGGGASAGRVGMPPELVRKARQLTQKHGTLLVIDEVISGFRWSPGGYQATISVIPDISSLAKLNGGGIPGGAAVCGQANVMEILKLRPEDKEWNRFRHPVHRGTWNGTPLIAAGAVATLKVVAKGEVQKKAENRAKRLVAGVNREIEKRGFEGCAYNAASMAHIYIGKCQKCDRTICLDSIKSMSPQLVRDLNLHLTLNGVHMLGGSMWVSAVHSEQDIDQTIDAFGAAFDSMLAEGIIKAK
jgi:glutamate-1-semialdehyde 2,1-aminomutase